MSDFADWSLEKQQQLWMKLAEDVIGRWHMPKAELSWLSYSNNAVFKVRASSSQYVLRFHPPGRVQASALRWELQWLRQIRGLTDLVAPLPISTSQDNNGGLFIKTFSRLLPDPHIVYGCLFEWLAGAKKSARQLTSVDVHQVGAYLGKLHTSAQLDQPASASRPRLDWQGLFGTDSPYHVQDSAYRLSAEQLDVFAQVAQRLRAVMLQLGQSRDSFGSIHGDLLAKNILFIDGVPAALDFEYCAAGYFLYDLAPLLWQLKGERAEDYDRLEDELWSGYTSIKQRDTFERGLLEDFIAARQLASCRWLLVNYDNAGIRAFAPQLIDARCQELRNYLESGVLDRQTPTL